MKGQLPQEFEDGMAFLREAADRLAADCEPKPPGDAVQAALGFPVDPGKPVDVEAVARNYDVSRLEARNPRLVKAITFMLGLHFLKHDVIATACGVGWETVAAVATQRSESIREFKGRMAQWLGFLMEAMTPVLLEKIRKGEVNFLDLKLLHDVWAPLAGEATARVEIKHTLPALQRLESVINEEAAKLASGMGCEGGKGFAVGGPVIEADFVELGTPNNSQCPDNRAQYTQDQ